MDFNCTPITAVTSFSRNSISFVILYLKGFWIASPEEAVGYLWILLLKALGLAEVYGVAVRPSNERVVEGEGGEHAVAEKEIELPLIEEDLGQQIETPDLKPRGEIIDYHVCS